MANSDTSSNPGGIVEDKIGDWSPQQLLRFVQDGLRIDPIPLPEEGVIDELTVVRKLKISDEIEFDGTGQTTVGAAGAASALPATPQGYIRVLDPNGTVRVIPFYLAS